MTIYMYMYIVKLRVLFKTWSVFVKDRLLNRRAYNKAVIFHKKSIVKLCFKHWLLYCKLRRDIKVSCILCTYMH